MTRRLIVLGATGCVGRAVIAEAAAAGLPTLAVARDGEALASLGSAHAQADVATLVADLGNDAGAALLAAHWRGRGDIAAGVVAAIGGAPLRGRLLDAPTDTLRRALDDDLLPHLSAARQLIPLLCADVGRESRGGYVLVGGPAADRPWAGYGQRSVAGAALQMLARVLHEEARALGVRVQLLSVESPARTDANARHACSGWPSMSAVARHAVALSAQVGDSTGAIVRMPADAALAAPAVFDDAQDADSRNDATAQISLRDARALLRSIATAPRIKEPSP